MPERLPNFSYHFARAEARAIRSAYAAALPAFSRQSQPSPAHLPFEVYSYSGESALPEQAASIRSLLRHAGSPKKWTVVSDGTYSPRSIALLQALNPVVSVSASTAEIPAGLDPSLRLYLTGHATGKQLALIMSLPVDGPALYVDSDVLFFPGARDLGAALALDRPQYYLADCQLSADERILRDKAERKKPINTGVLFLRSKLEWSLSIKRFLELDGPPNFFTNQTMTHLTMHANGAAPLDPKTFVLQLDDQFLYGDHYASSKIILRHYVNPVRHKFWNALWRFSR
ncbi:MAG: hypothetical protein H0U88_03680 [Chthoniobacterales bacterium]|nr:hypothetical protein [Chthoniobacterales bacterium]